MTRAIITAWHKYQPYGGEFYEPILDNYIKTMTRFNTEYDKIYFLDSNWNIDPKRLEGLNAEIIRINPSTRYYDAYKQVVPQVTEDLILFMDNDMMVTSSGIIYYTFKLLGVWDVVTIIDQIGEYKTDKLKLGNKFCPYWFATKKELISKYLDEDWSPDMPFCETLGHLTERMLNDNVKAFEVEDDKTEFPTKDLGYYHIRAGSTPAVLLAYKHNDIEKYWEYLKNQPKSEYLRQCEWYKRMGGDPTEIIEDSKDL